MSPEQVDETFALLQNRRRRLVLASLREHESTTQGDLARHIAAIENEIPEEAVTSTQRKRVYVSLYQAHLPKLDDFGAIDFDTDRGTVERTPGTEPLLQCLDRLDEPPADPPRATGSASLTGTALLAVALGAVALGELGVFPEGVALGIAGALSVGGLGIVVYRVRQ